MRRLTLGAPSAGNFMEWVIRSLKQIEQASFDEDIGAVADAYTIQNLTPTRTLDVSTATEADIAAVLGTFITDMKNRGTKRGNT